MVKMFQQLFLVSGCLLAVSQKNPFVEGVPIETSKCVQLEPYVVTKDTPGAFSTLQLVGSRPCVMLPGSETEGYQLGIKTPEYGRYEIMEFPGNTGFAWNAPADGINYCISGGKAVYFDEFVSGATVYVWAAPNAASKCKSDYIGFNGVKNLDKSFFSKKSLGSSSARSKQDTGKVFWSSHKYVLQAESFSFHIQGEPNVQWDSSSVSDLEVRGDPGGADYMSIEITWFPKKTKTEHRLFMYFNADGPNSWTVNEIRLYNKQGDWEFFKGENLLSAAKGSCYHKPHLSLTNKRGSKIEFSGLALAAFLPWTDNADVKHCIASSSSVLATGYGDDKMSLIFSLFAVIFAAVASLRMWCRREQSAKLGTDDDVMAMDIGAKYSELASDEAAAGDPM